MNDRLHEAFQSVIERMAEPPTWEEINSTRATREGPRLDRRWVAALATFLVVLLVGGTLTLLDGAGLESGDTVAGGMEACPVSESVDHGFSPASEAPDGPPASYEAAWYGTPQLWTMIRHDGEIWTGLPEGPDGSLVQKTFWWSEELDLSDGQAPAISLIAEQIGDEELIYEAEPATSGGRADIGTFMIVGLELPTPGCWQITASYQGTSLSYVAWAEGRAPTD